MELGFKIRELRKNLKLSQADFAQKIGVSPKTIAFWENGNNEPTKNSLFTICNKCNLPLNYFEENVINVSEINNNDIVKIPYWSQLPDELKNPDFSCVTAERNVILNHWYLKPENLCIVPMVGDKMAHYWYPINNGDILIIDTEQQEIRGNGVYFATSQNNTRFWIREMQVLVNNDIEFKGFAPSGETVRVLTQEELNKVDFKIIGKVIKNVSFRL